MIELSVVIVNYNTKELLRRCLRSVFLSHLAYDFEVIVSDNGSKDGSSLMVKQEFPKTKLLENYTNLGFSKGNNIALKIAEGKYCLLLNSDTEIMPDALRLSTEYLEENLDVGILGAKVLLPDGTLDPSCRRRFPNPFNSFLTLFGFRKFSDYNVTGDLDKISKVDSVMGAYLMISREAMDKIGLLDEEFFMYGEDIDWCWRAKEVGYKVVYYPASVIIHYKYGSSQKIADKTIEFAHQAMKIFYRKHYEKDYPYLLNLLVYFGIDLRKHLVKFFNFFKVKKTVH